MTNRNVFIPIGYFLALTSSVTYALPEGFVYLRDVSPDIIEEMRYAGHYNFLGRPVPGYLAPRCILTKTAAEQLGKVQSAAAKQGYRLKVYDCYRPKTAVNAFYQWSKTPELPAMKEAFYPREKKNELFKKGYIALQSGHSRGSTVDITLVKTGNSVRTTTSQDARCYGKTTAYLDDNSIDMGTRFDCLDSSAHIHYSGLTKEQKANRQRLRELMVRHGFRPYAREWWHFTLRDEPYPGTYFNFPVR
ncbi:MULTISPECIES: M15 family metallopeptidase [unclassified Legionella]|uniref:M15 family metallopeptidase n=1 Tax=unclassified Legionella TaxID=2622702 RepID=UPI001054AA50|nr:MULTISPECIES: M15 family metallopeptidase [unclassified Legionella]MDI9819170.1 M15 family metallopeptidase [Legionella sp. PL877]